jgi:hypothetical protein
MFQEKFSLLTVFDDTLELVHTELFIRKARDENLINRLQFQAE